MVDMVIDKVTFHYIKSNLFRVIHVDGALGGITPSGFLQFSVYSERACIPVTTEHPISADGGLGEPSSEEGKKGIVREVDANLIMSIKTATELRAWLNARIEEYDRLAKAK